MRQLKIAVLLLLIPFLGKGQSYQSQQVGLAVYNVGLGGFIGGIGAVINKKDDQATYGKTFFRGFWRGCVGGSVNFLGKKTSSLIASKHEYGYGWAAKVVHSLGTSIIENAATNREMLENYALEIGFVRLDVNTKTGNVLPRVKPFSFAGFAYHLFVADFKAKTSLQLGNPFFTSTSRSPYALFDNIIYPNIPVPNRDKYQIVNHETIHVLQGREYNAVNLFYSERIKGINKYIFLDLPISSLAYEVSERSKGEKAVYDSNFFEFEANSFSRMKYVERNKK